MKILQDLVPGCNKVIGKALVLDEIINYIQSLQHQVEFLSMKLEAVNSRMNPAIDVFPPKDYGHQIFETSGMAFGSQATREYNRDVSPEWLHIGVLAEEVYCIMLNQRDSIISLLDAGHGDAIAVKKNAESYCLKT
ncbi:hypothetical protein V6N11_073702 [Hibiscus sabdariffa]|uniref:BHLH domain-containing protein n=1 Tax=Hibiscus sabdariffa TaxID=183260 RepID=A0ABR1ZB03_9ROSI